MGKHKPSSAETPTPLTLVMAEDMILCLNGKGKQWLPEGLGHVNLPDGVSQRPDMAGIVKPGERA